MASASTSRNPDIEAQRDTLQPHQAEIYEATSGLSEVASNAGRAPEDLARPVAYESQAIDNEGADYMPYIDIQPPEREEDQGEDITRQTPTRVEHGEVQPGADTQAQYVVEHPGGPVANDFIREPRMIGDFHGSTNALWNLYGKEAKSHDEACIQPLKEDMDGVLIFAGLSATALTSFVVDSKQNLQVKPTDQMVYYLQQHSTILSQISQQIASIAPEVSIPSTPPAPFPSFKPSASDVRINVFWFMALAFSLSAALLAILVQQWVRDYMHVFQRYSDFQKSSRMRQYLYEGSEGWYMPIAAEAVPALLHVSLFLFFAGLADSTMNINTTIGVTTTIPIGICGLLYIFITFAPVIYPQSSYQTSFSGVIWYAVQKLRDRRFLDRDGKSKPVSTNMAQGRMQLSMEETKERNGRDKRAILWLLDNLTEDDDIESFVMSAPGSLEVWTELSKEGVIPVVTEPSSRLRTIQNLLGLIHRSRTSSASDPSTNAMVHRPALYSSNHHSIVTTSVHERITIREFCWRVGHFFDTCKNRAVLADDGLRWMRARACVEAMASLVFYADAEVDWFGDTREALGDIGSFEGIRDLSLARRDEAFVVRWTCLSIMAIQSTLERNLPLRPFALAFNFLFHVQDREDRAREIDETLEQRWATEHESDLSSKISFAADMMQEFNEMMIDREATKSIDEASQRITRELPGVDFDFPDPEPSLRQSLELIHDPPKLRFISCQQPLSKFFDYLKRLDGSRDNSPNSEDEVRQAIKNVFWPKQLIRRTLWSHHDLIKGGLGFTAECFLLSLRQLLCTYPSHESYSALYIGTFQAITSNRRGPWIHPFGTQKILLDVVASDQGLLRTFDYPDYITDEIWVLLGDILEGLTGPHIDRAVQKLTDLEREVGGRYGAKAEEVISRIRASHS